MTETWTLISYRAPAHPSSARVTAWRRVHRLGAVYLGPSACALPTRLVAEDELAAVASGLRSAGGSFDVYVVAGEAQCVVTPPDFEDVDDDGIDRSPVRHR